MSALLVVYSIGGFVVVEHICDETKRVESLVPLEAVGPEVDEEVTEFTTRKFVFVSTILFTTSSSLLLPTVSRGVLFGTRP